MQIKRHCSKNFNITGNYLLKVLTYGNHSLLDLLVRESIQNSLDAAKDDSAFVKVDYSLAKFRSTDFNNELEDITDSLNKRFAKGTYKSLVISDYNTTGLDGQFTLNGLTSFQDSGRFYKLVFDITRGNQNEAAGGSWGLGKTIYYQIGIGIVVFYTRIKQGNSYESRLAVSLVEDEQSTNRIMPNVEGDIPTGIAWWGEIDSNNSIVPITDEIEIKRILSILNVDEYVNNETGTKIIIPYINPHPTTDLYLDRLIPTRMEHKNLDNPVHVNFEQDILMYIRNSVYKWYMPRLNEKYGDKYLKVSLNKNDVDKEEQDLDIDCEIPEIFKLIRALYNTANDNVDQYLLDNKEIHVVSESIIANKYVFDNNQNIGRFVCVKIPIAKLKPRPSSQDPTIYLGLDNKNLENSAIILKTRKPGMIVRYDSISSRKIDLASTDILIGLFVVDKKNILKKEYSKSNEDMNLNLSVEEYFRKGEPADHFTWSDSGIYDSRKNTLTTPKIIEKLDDSIKNILENNYSAKIIERERNFNTSLGDLLGELLLPPEDYGQRPTDSDSEPNSQKNNNGGSGRGRPKDASKIELYSNLIEYNKNIVSIPSKIHFRKGTTNINCELYIDTLNIPNSLIDWRSWEKMTNLSMPFYFDSIEFPNQQTRRNTNSKNSNMKFEIDGIIVSFEYSDKEKCIGVNFKFEKSNNSKDIDLIFNIAFDNKDYKPHLKSKVESTEQ